MQLYIHYAIYLLCNLSSLTDISDPTEGSFFFSYAATSGHGNPWRVPKTPFTVP